MQQRKTLNRMLGIASLAILFGAPSVYAQTQTESSKDAAGMTQENRAGQASPTGQNETSTSTSGTSGTSTGGAGVSTSGTSDSSGSSGTSGASGSSGSSGASGTSGASGSSADSSAQPSSGASTAGSSASGAAASGKALSKSDQGIMRELAQSNLAEIEAGKLALSQSKNDEVKSFAQKMVDDHTQAQQELEQLAQAKGVTLPTEPDSKHKTAMKKLGALEGDKFDKQYMAQGGMKDHRDTHKLLNRAEKRASDSELKALVTKMQPIVADHMKMAQDMKGGKGSATGSSGSSGASGSSMGPAGTSSTPGSSGSSGSSTSGSTAPEAAGGTTGSGTPGSSGTSSSDTDGSGK